MYIAQAFNVLHDWWRYLVGLLITFVAWQLIGMIPLGIAIGIKAFGTGEVPTTISEMSTILGSNLFLFLMLVSFAFGLIGVLFSSRVLHSQSFKHLTTTRRQIDWKRFWFIFVLWGVVSSSFVLVDYYLTPEDYLWNFDLIPFLILCVIAIVLIPLQTSFEEYLFRGYLMQGLGVSSIHKNFPFVLIYTILSIIGFIYFNNLYSFGLLYSCVIFAVLVGVLVSVLNIKVFDRITTSSESHILYKVFKRNFTPLIITSVIFGLMHILNPEVEKLGYVIMVYYIGTGLFLGIITLMDEGLELALGFHAANNLFTALLVTADWTAFQTHSILKDLSDPEAMGLMEIFVPVFVVFPILLLILSKKYKWTNWKDKLFGAVVKPPKEDYKIIE